MDTLELSLRRDFGGFQLDFESRCGRGITALFGRSGSGKSTVIQMICGLSKPESGRIAVDGRVLFDSSSGVNLAPEKRRIGCVFQEDRLFPHLSVLSNLRFGMARISRSERKITFESVVEILGIGHLLERRPYRLSGGEKQRVAIGRALLANPKLLLMDEPLSSLDQERKAEVLPFIAKISTHFAIPILYVSHSIDEVLRLADELLFIDAGRAIASGPPEQVLGRPELRWIGGPDGPSAAIRAHVVSHDEHWASTRLTFNGGQLTIGRLDLPPGSTVRVRVHARDVTLARERPSAISTRNVLAATVLSLAPTEGRRVDVLLDCAGSALWSRITAEAAAELQLASGTRVFVLLKAVAIARDDLAERTEGEELTAPSDVR